MSPQPSTELLLNRELGILEFNRRVLAQADDLSTPLLERLRFLCIFSSNMDEFFEVRVSGLKEQIRLNPQLSGPDGLSARRVFREVSRLSHELVARQYALFNNEVIPDLGNEDIRFLRRTHWNEEQAAWIREFFFNELMPVG